MFSDTKILKLRGGLGNQMFIYAFGMAWGGADVCFDTSWFKEIKNSSGTFRIMELGAFGIKPKKRPLLSYIMRLGKYEEKPGNLFQPELLGKTNCIMSGSFQSEKYFKNIRDKVLDAFSLKIPMGCANMEMLKQIHDCNSVCIHIRRGDYLNLSAIHYLQTPQYFASGIEIMRQNVKNPHFFIFSEDMDWAHQNIDFGNDPVTFVNINDGDNGIFALELMKNCKHNIIANSSFSWWAAWLNENPEKIVVAPNQWHAPWHNWIGDAIPQGWIII